jgi:hypothetical protein
LPSPPAPDQDAAMPTRLVWVVVDAANPAAQVARAAEVGQGDVPWVVLADPEGSEFCVLSPR